MSWVTVGVAGAGMLVGGLNAKQKQKQEKSNQMANATAIEMSPWTGQNPGMMGSSAPSTLGGALQGGLSGAMMASQFGKGTAPDAKVAPSSTGYEAASAKGLEFSSPTLGGMGASSPSPTGDIASNGGSPWSSMGQDPNALPTLNGMRPRKY